MMFFATAAAFALALMRPQPLDAAAPANEKSKERINSIIKIVVKYRDAGQSLSDPDVKEAILNEVAEIVPLEPESQAKAVSFDDVAAEVRKKVALRFPDKHDSLKQTIQAEADKKFKMAAIMDYVTVKYMKGEKTYTAEGVFYGYGIGNKSVNIDQTHIPIVDLVDEDRAKYDKAFREQKVKEFMNGQIDTYYKRKQAYTNNVKEEIMGRISRENEEKGFIFAWNKWRSAKSVVDILVDDMGKNKGGGESGTEQGTEVAETGTKPSADKTPPKENPKGTPPDLKPENPDPATKTTASLDKNVLQLMKKADDEWIRISNTYAGIDADQGYKPALWWMKSKDVNLLFPKFLKPDDTSEVKILTYPPGDPIESVELHFFNGYFYKAVMKFRIAKTVEAMVELAKKIRDKYGPSDDEKEPEPPPEGEAPAEGAPPADQKPAEQPPPEGEQPSGADIPVEESYVWTGKITKAQLLIRRNPEKTAIIEFTFTKENPKIVPDQQEKMEKEKADKEKREREEELKRYQDFRVTPGEEDKDKDKSKDKDKDKGK